MLQTAIISKAIKQTPPPFTASSPCCNHGTPSLPSASHPLLLHSLLLLHSCCCIHCCCIYCCCIHRCCILAAAAFSAAAFVTADFPSALFRCTHVALTGNMFWDLKSSKICPNHASSQLTTLPSRVPASSAVNALVTGNPAAASDFQLLMMYTMRSIQK